MLSFEWLLFGGASVVTAELVDFDVGYQRRDVPILVSKREQKGSRRAVGIPVYPRGNVCSPLNSGFSKFSPKLGCLVANVICQAETCRTESAECMSETVRTPPGWLACPCDR